MNHIFISYSRKDEKIVDQFVAVLRRNNLPIWQDKMGAGSGIPFSTKWFSMIEEALYLSSGAIIFMSENWKKSTPCKDELELMKKRDLPYLEISVASLMANPQFAFEQVRDFYYTKVALTENEHRTKVFTTAYELKNGVDPYQLLDHTKGIGKTLSQFVLYSGMKVVIKSRNYRELNPDLYPYMERFNKFARNILLKRLITRVIGGVIAVVAFILVMAGVEVIKQSTELTSNMYLAETASATLTRAREIDPAAAVQGVEQVENQYAETTAFWTFNWNALKLVETTFPEKVLIAHNADYDTYLSEKVVTESALFEASSNQSSIYLVRRSDCLAWTINAVAKVDLMVWNDEGTILAYTCGHRVFVYDPQCHGQPIELMECFDRVEELKFSFKDGEERVAARTRNEDILVWKSPLQRKTIKRSAVEYGVFLDTESPSVVYVEDNTIVINQNQSESEIQLDLDGKLKTGSFDVSHDNSKLAAIFEQDGKTGVLCVDLRSGKELFRVMTDTDVRALRFHDDDQSIYGASYGSMAVKIDVATGSVTYGNEKLYYTNLVRWGTGWILTDIYGFCAFMNDDLEKTDRSFRVNLAVKPCFDLATAESKDALFMVNRGGGTHPYCSRANISRGDMQYFIVPFVEKSASNTAVAVSSDDGYVAFGYPNGTVRVYEVESMYCVGEYQKCGEPIVALHFSQDVNTIYALGESGNLFMIDFPHLDLITESKIRSENWMKMKKKVSDRYEEYQKGISS